MHRTLAAMGLASLHELGVMLADHVRLEERELFVLIEQTLLPDELAAVGAGLSRGGCRASAPPTAPAG